MNFYWTYNTRNFTNTGPVKPGINVVPKAFFFMILETMEIISPSSSTSKTNNALSASRLKRQFRPEDPISYLSVESNKIVI